MSYFYTPLTGFHLEVLGDAPEGAVPVTPSRHAELMEAQARGAEIVPSPDTGAPVIQWPVHDVQTRRAVVRRAIKREAAQRIVTISPEWRQLNDMRAPTEASAVRFVQIDAVRAASNAIEELLEQASADAIETFPVRDHPLWPELEEPA